MKGRHIDFESKWQSKEIDENENSTAILYVLISEAVLIHQTSQMDNFRSYAKKLHNLALCRKRKSMENDYIEAVPIRVIFRFASKKEIIYVISGVIMALIGGGIEPLVVIIGGLISDIYIRKNETADNEEFLADVMAYNKSFSLLFTFAFIAAFLQAYFLQNGCVELVTRIRKKYVEAILNQDADWWDERSSGQVTAQLNEYIDLIYSGLSDKLGVLVRSVGMFLSSVVYCCWIDIPLTMIVLTIGPLFAAAITLMGRLTSKYSQNMMKTSGKINEIIEEAVMNVKTVASCNSQRHMVEKLRRTQNAGMTDCKAYNWWSGLFMGLSLGISGMIIGVSYWFGCYSYFEGRIKHPGDVILIVGAVQLTDYFFVVLGSHTLAIRKAQEACARIYAVIDRKPHHEKEASEVQPRKINSGNLSFDNVHFGYHRRDQPILKGLTFEAKAGETIGLVGQSGCGKSTTIALITKLYSPTSGSIQIDGAGISSHDMKCLRKSIGIVQQEPCLFNGTIRENIGLGRSVTDEEIENAARMANAHEFISSLEKGYDTELGPGGIALSGGQKQRIAIARAIVTDPKILLLDEATSALDSISEKTVQDALNKATKGRTTIVIAHRLSTLRDAGRIYLIENGKVKEAGSHEELLKLDETYANMARAQEVNRDRSRKLDEEANGKDDFITDFGNRKDVWNQESMRLIRQSSRVVKTSECVAENKRINKASLLDFYKFVLPYKVAISIVIFSIALRGIKTILDTFLTTLAFHTLKETKSTYFFYAIMIVVGGNVSALVGFVTVMLMKYTGDVAAEKVLNDLRVAIFNTLLHRKLEYFDRPSTSNAACVSLISQFAPVCRGNVDERMIQTIFLIFFTLCYLITAFIVSWELGLLGLALSITLGAIMLFAYSLSYSALRRKMRDDKSSECAIEIAEQIRTIQLMSVEDYFLEKYHKCQNFAMKLEKKKILIDSISYAISQSFVLLGDMACFVLGTYLIYFGRYTPERVFLAISYAKVPAWRVMYAAPHIQSLSKSNGAATELMTLLNGDKHLVVDINKGLKPEIVGDVQVSAAKFSYPSRSNVNVTRGLSIRARKGEDVALVGASGCGKSTVVSLLERFYDLKGGEITIDSIPIRDISIEHLRNNMALVSQEPTLFSGTIIENITMGCPSATLKDVMQACRIANASSFIESFPLAYETDVGEKGGNFSGGQKQRIAIARALVRNPKILLLDEATSALDPVAEEAIQMALKEAAKGRTTITIAHRLKSIQHCDRICYIENGKTVECGTHAELLNLNGKYNQLIKDQVLDPK